MKTLYFDINGTLTSEYRCKPALAAGAFERAVRQAGFERLVCVSNLQNTIRLLAELGRPVDSLAMIFDMCFGAFADQPWFRQVTSLVADPGHRAAAIDFTGDWWYLDDLAEEFLANDGLQSRLHQHIGGRVLAPHAASDGAEILDWLRAGPPSRVGSAARR